MKALFLAIALLTAGCTPTTLVSSPVGEDLRSTEPGLAPDGYIQFCRDTPQSDLCKK